MQLVDEMRRVSRGLVGTEEAAHGSFVCSASSPEKPEARPISLISHASEHLPSGDPGHPAFAYVSRPPGLANDRPSRTRRRARARVMSSVALPATLEIERSFVKKAEMAELLAAVTELR